WAGSRPVQTTDDAYLRADITPLSTRVSGTVTDVAVNDYQRVKAGDLLVQIKSADFRAQVAQAEAGVSGARAALENNSRQRDLQYSKIDQSRTAVEASRADVEQTEAGIGAAQADRTNARAGVKGAAATISASQAGVEGAKADLLVSQANV